MKILKYLGIVLGIVVILVIGLVLFVVFTDYVPEAIEIHEFINTDNQKSLSDELTITTFNIGYCGLDSNQDFFMDGGTGSRSSSQEQTQINLDGNIKTLNELNSDIYIIQEVDIDSTRSYHINEMQAIIEGLSDYSYSFVHNYLVPWVPIPLNLPMGKAESGLLTMVKGTIVQATRYDLPKDPTIPDKYFLLDRCMDEVIIPLDDNKKLHVINLHLSAYDSAGVIKKEQMQFLREFIMDLNLENDYYIFGGDWNQLLSKEIVIDREKYNPEWLGNAPTDFDDLPFIWAYDITVNTVRDLYESYHPGSTFETVIDGFLVSENIEIIDVKTIDAGFVNSDHNPVTMKVKLH
ncbi:MAG: endonuclease/exonuclease/phosphatase family protein [Clostridiales bacterium]|nr:endonuclease/exonuclease/phosphatase family protein [Clostridiales bacterium]